MPDSVKVESTDQMRGRRPAGAVAVAVAVSLLALALLSRALWVHHVGGEWRLTPSAVPPRICVDDRQYSLYRQVDRFPLGLEPQGSTPGGGEVFTGDASDVLAPLRAYVVNNGETFSYFSEVPPASC
jgi:hypothetical protein